LFSSKRCKYSTKWWWWFNEDHELNLVDGICLWLWLACCYLIDMTSKLEAWLLIIDIIPPCQRQGEKMRIFPPKDVSILENQFFSMTDIYSWFLMTIAKKWSTHSDSLLLKVSCVWNIFMKDDCDFYNVRKDEYQNNDPLYGQLDDNFGI